MTHWMTLDDWDSDGINPAVRCDCALGEDHYQELDCPTCGAERNKFGRCWYCDRAWIWTEEP